MSRFIELRFHSSKITTLINIDEISHIRPAEGGGSIIHLRSDPGEHLRVAKSYGEIFQILASNGAVLQREAI